MAELGRYRSTTSPYAALYDRADAIAARAMASTVDPEVVVRALWHAVTSRRPRVRYVAPFRVGVALALARLVPTRWLDALLCNVLGLTRRGLGLSGRPSM
jgi:hypothetical protein